MPKPRGATGATKMKIMAIVCHNEEYGQDSYGYNIWQALKTNFHTYLDDDEVRNVYHHLKGLCELELLSREEGPDAGSNRCFYRMTDKGASLKEKYKRYLDILGQESELV